MTTTQVEIPNKLIPIFSGEADVRGAYGGRGSAKTVSFAKMTAVRAYMWAAEGRRGIVLCARQFMNSLEDSSLEEIKQAIRSESWLSDFFDIGEKYIRTKDGNISYSFSGLDRNIDSIKSKSKILLCWVDEAEPVRDAAWVKLIPSVREEGSELWVTWNPERKGSPTDVRFRHIKSQHSKIVELNWRDNAKFPSKLNRTRLEDLENNPDEYDHIWEGGYKTAVKGAYYSPHIQKSKEEGRWGTEDSPIHVAEDPLLIVRIFIDIGGTGAKSDNFVMWAAQFVGQNINWINHYEAQGQEIGHHLDWLRAQGYTNDRCKIWLPHDGSTQDRVFSISYESAFKKAGYKTVVVPNQGKGAAKKRIEEMRNQFSRMWFDQKCQGGMDALSCYHEKRDDERGIGLGPNHDWSSHSSDAAGMGAIVYKTPDLSKKNRSKRQVKISMA